MLSKANAGENCLINEVGFTLCDAIYTGKRQQMLKKSMYGNFSDIQRLPKTGKKLDSFAAHHEQHFKSITSHTDIHMCMMFK